MKTLIVTYLPSGAASNTRKLLDLFLELAPAGGRDEIDLLATPAPLFTTASMAAYLKRHYARQPLDAAEAAQLAGQDALIARLLAADVLVLAYPMHNFSMPAAVKAWFDAVMAKDVTFRKTPDGFAPMLPRLKALTLYTAGTEYPQGSLGGFPHWDGVAALSRIEFEFMGVREAEAIGVSLRGDAATREAKLADVRRRLAALVERWYRPAEATVA
jgi:FMN-dependent NADH-azoreductase